MDTKVYNEYTSILKAELLPAMGCTEPISVAYTAALAREALGALPEKVEVLVSGNIIKNAKSVVVPNTGGMKGIAAAAAIGIIAGDARRELEVISSVTPENVARAKEYLASADIRMGEVGSGYIFDICVTVFGNGHTALARVAGSHINVIRIERDGASTFEREYIEEAPTQSDRSALSIEGIVEYADALDVEDVREVLERQIKYNCAIAEEGLRGDWGAGVGKVLLEAYGNDVHNRAKAWAAAGSDARMNGCEMPVIINAGSGNQGMTASLPVIVYARDMGAGEGALLRALTVSNLVSIHLKTGIGCLSAFCGATSAGCGAGAGVMYLYDGKYSEIAHTIVNAVAIDSGMICDGAKASCAAKIASAVEAGLLGMQMARRGREFFGGDGIIIKGVENTIKNIGRLAKKGMCETDREIIKMMTGKD